MFSQDGYYDKPVPWIGVATSRDFMSISEHKGEIDHPIGEPWTDEDEGVHKVIIMADCGEGAFMEGTELLQKYIDDEPWRNLP